MYSTGKKCRKIFQKLGLVAFPNLLACSQSWAAATYIVAPLSLPLFDEKSSGAAATAT